MFLTPNAEKLRLFFAGLTEYTFESRLGIADPALIDYISALLTRFSYSDEIYRVRTPDGRPIDQVAEMFTVAAQKSIADRREIHRHIGDYTLFWSGLYPEALQRLQAARRADRWISYPEQGKRAYYLASQAPVTSQASSDEATAEVEILERLSHDFDLCQAGLAELRKEWQHRDDPDVPPPLFK